MSGYSNNGKPETLVKDGRKLHIYVSPVFAAAERTKLIAWIRFISDTLADVYGHWPRREWQISVAPASAAVNDPIPWAQVHRGDIDRVAFYTAPRATEQQLRQAWTGYHELAHLLIPYQGWGDVWFTEGLASYYQNILQGRSGILTEQQTWQRLYEGFMRGRANAMLDGQPLSSVSKSMRQNSSYMRVYWSGAWYFLVVDSRLRQQSGGKMTLDLALKALNECCANESLSAAAIVAKLDQLNNVLLFERLYLRVNASTAMPAFEKTFASLGITVIEGAVHLQQKGPGAQLRRQITQPKAL